MIASGIESFDELIRRLGGQRLPPTAQATKKLRMLTYLRENGRQVVMAVDVLDAVGSLSSEEELAAYLCREGVAVSHSSDGWWLLFRSDQSVTASNDASAAIITLSHVGERSC